MTHDNTAALEALLQRITSPYYHDHELIPIDIRAMAMELTQNSPAVSPDDAKAEAVPVIFAEPFHTGWQYRVYMPDGDVRSSFNYWPSVREAEIAAKLEYPAAIIRPPLTTTAAQSEKE